MEQFQFLGLMMWMKKRGNKMEKSFRLSSDGMFSRPEEIFPETPLRIIFLSVEGNVTEQNYFGWLEKYREKLGIKTGVHVHPLRRGKRDNFSAPAQVLELLEEYIEIRESDILPNRMRKVIPTKYTDAFVQQYMKDPDSVDKDKKEQFEMLLKQVGIDLEYQFFVKEYQGQDDLFGVVIDRDYNTHTVMQLNEIRKQCIEKGYHFFITTPCFEFWLLLHLVDVKKQYKGDMQKFRDNEKKQTSIHLPVFKFLNMRDTQKKSVKKFLDNIILIILIMQFHRLKNFSLQM
jgi:hypothetical protein